MTDSPMYRVLEEMRELHDRKNHDYGIATDPFANVRASERFGIPPWLGAIVRLNDKITRISSFCKNGQLANESLRDSLIDIAVYAAIAVALYDEAELLTAGSTNPVHMKEVTPDGGRGHKLAVGDALVAEPQPILAGMVDGGLPYCYCPDTRFGDHPGHPVHLKGYKPGETERDKKGGLPMRWYVVMAQEPGHAEVQRWLDIIE